MDERTIMANLQEFQKLIRDNNARLKGIEEALNKIADGLAKRNG